MESGLEGRNNQKKSVTVGTTHLPVSMESGLEGRNNDSIRISAVTLVFSLNGVRPRRPEQWIGERGWYEQVTPVSMESGLEGRNNGSPRKAALTRDFTSFCERFAPQTPITTLC